MKIDIDKSVFILFLFTDATWYGKASFIQSTLNICLLISLSAGVFALAAPPHF